MKVRAKIGLFKHQMEFLKSEAEHACLVGGFGSGKTEAGIFRLFNLMKIYGPEFEKIGSRYVFGVYQPNYKLIKKSLFPRFESLLSSYNIKYKLNRSEFTIDIPSFNTQILFVSMENPETIIAYETCDAWCDELDTLKKDKAEEVFNKIIGRNRQPKPDGKLNTCCVTTTPEGKRYVYHKWEKAENKDKYQIIRGRTADNTFLAPSYLENLKEQYPLELFLAYTEGLFVNMTSGLVYTSYKREDNDTKVTIESYFTKSVNKELHIGMDFNVGKMAAVISIHEPEDKELIIVDEIFGASDTPDMISVIQERYEGFKIYVYPDAAGRQRKSTNSSISDIKLLQEAGFSLRAERKNPFIKDRVMAVNGMLKNAKGDIRLFINSTKCTNLVENLEDQTYNQKTGQPDKTSDNDHMLDALGYLVNKLYSIKKQIAMNKS